MKLISQHYLKLSVLLNLVLIGGIAGFWMQQSSHGHEKIQNRNEKLAELIAVLPEEKRIPLAIELQADIAENKERMKQIRLIKKDIVTLLQADMFDVQAYRTRVTDMRKHYSGMWKEHSDLMLRIVAELPKEQRVELAKDIEKQDKTSRMR